MCLSPAWGFAGQPIGGFCEGGQLHLGRGALGHVVKHILHACMHVWLHTLPTCMARMHMRTHTYARLPPRAPLQVSLTWLDLSFNLISKIENLSPLTKLVDLSLFQNQISEIENLDALVNLNVLSLGVCVEGGGGCH